MEVPVLLRLKAKISDILKPDKEKRILPLIDKYRKEDHFDPAKVNKEIYGFIKSIIPDAVKLNSKYYLGYDSIFRARWEYRLPVHIEDLDLQVKLTVTCNIDNRCRKVVPADLFVTVNIPRSYKTVIRDIPSSITKRYDNYSLCVSDIKNVCINLKNGSVKF